MNDNLFLFLNGLMGKSLNADTAVIFLADAFPYIVILLAGLYLVVHFKIFRSKNVFHLIKEKWKEMLFVPSISGLAWFISYLLKILIKEPRPFEIFDLANSLFLETGFAFPSGHSTFFMALGTAMYFLNKKAGLIFIFFALLIGISRIFAGVHYPLDILAGFLLGFVVVYIVKKY